MFIKLDTKNEGFIVVNTDHIICINPPIAEDRWSISLVGWDWTLKITEASAKGLIDLLKPAETTPADPDPRVAQLAKMRIAAKRLADRLGNTPREELAILAGTAFHLASNLWTDLEEFTI